MDRLKTSELATGDVARCVGGRDDGKLFRITSANGTSGIGVHVLTRDGRRDRRYTGWTGWYADCEWELVSHQDEPAPASPAP